MMQRKNAEPTMEEAVDVALNAVVDDYEAHKDRGRLVEVFLANLHEPWGVWHDNDLDGG